MIIDEFVIQMGLDPSALQKGVATAKQAVANMAKSVKQSLSNMAAGARDSVVQIARNIPVVLENMAQRAAQVWTSLFQSFALAASAAFALYIKDANKLGKTAKDIGVAVETLSTLENAVNSAGNSTQELEKDMKMLAEETGGNAYGALKELAELADEMGEAEYTSYAEALGLSRATIDLTKDGTDALKSQIVAAKELGIINRQDAKDAKEFSTAITNLGMAFRGTMNIVFRMVLPMFKRFTDAMTKVVVFLRKNEQFIKFFFIGLAAVITGVALPAILSLSAAMLASPITWLIAMVAALALALDDMFGWMEGKESAWGDFWAQIWGTEDPEEARKKFEELKQGAIEFFSSMSDYLPTAKDLWDGLTDAIKLLIKVLKQIIDVFSLIKGAWDLLVDALSTGIDYLTKKFEAFGRTIQEALRPYVERGQALTGNAQTGDTVAAQNKYGLEADGGIFTSPTRAIIGEAGAEAVIPFSPGKRNRGLELLSKIAGNLMPNISAAQALPMGGASTNNITTDTRVNVGTVNISAADGTDAANQFMTGIETRAARWTAAANVAY